MNLGTISHPNPIIDRKVKHFYDHLRYLASPNKNLVTCPLENHLHLLERIQFKLNNPVLYPSSVRVIEKYFNSNPLFHTGSDFFSRKAKIRALISVLKGANSKSTIDESFRSTFKALVVELNGEKELNGDKYFLSILNELTKSLNSKTTIEEEKHKIEYFSNLFLSEFLRSRFHVDDFAGFRGIMSKILSKRVEIYDGIESDLYSAFPLPHDIESQRNEDGFKKTVETFLNNRTFAQQFKGFHTELNTEKEAEFLFKIYNVVEKNPEFHFEHNTVELFHQNCLNVNMSTWDEDYIDSFKKFTEEKDTILAKVKIKYKSQKLAAQAAILKIREAIDFLNFVSKDKKKNYTGAILGTNQYYLIFNGGESIRGVWQDDKIHSVDFNIQPVVEFLYPKGFKKLNTGLQEIFHRNDKVLFRARNTNYWDEKVNNYWRFLDGIFGYGLEKISGSEVIKKATNIILISEKNFSKERLRYTITNALNNSDTETIKLTIKPAPLAYKTDQIYKGKGDILELEGISDYPFINENFKKYKKDEVDYLSAYNFYSTLLWETYEQRNFAFHQNNFCFSTVDKLVKILPTVINRLREVIVNELISNRELSIQEAIEQLNEKGANLKNQVSPSTQHKS